MILEVVIDHISQSDKIKHLIDYFSKLGKSDKIKHLIEKDDYNT